MDAITSNWQNLALYTAAVWTVGYSVGCYKTFVMDRAMVRAAKAAQFLNR